MKIMIVGAWCWPQYEEAFSKSLNNKSVAVIPLKTSSFFNGVFGRIQHKFPLVGPALVMLNIYIIKIAKISKPDFVLFWRPTHIHPKTLSVLNKLGVRTISYNNDDPFGPKNNVEVPWHHQFLWRNYIKCLPLFNLNYFYRAINCKEAFCYGAKHADILMPYFLPWKDRPVKLSENDQSRFDTDVVFVGHYENDGRANIIRSLVKSGIKVKVWGGPYWNLNVLKEAYEILSPITMAHGDDYQKALCGAKICLAFLSKINRDTYTRRCFEIPASGSLMLSERTDDLLKLFKEDEEACFFSTPEELINKVRWLIKNPKIRSKIALAGMKRVWSDGHDLESRVSDFVMKLQTVQEIT